MTRSELSADGGRRTTQHLDDGTVNRSASERVHNAAYAMRAALVGARLVASTKVMRADQETVFSSFAKFLEAADVHFAATPNERFTFARVVLPPRTGKTVPMGEFIAATAATAVVLVPTQTLVRQTAERLQAQLPTVSVGVYYGGEKRLVQSGVMVATYQIVQMGFKDGSLPAAIRDATLVFCDEGHHAMSEDRVRMLEAAFQPGALRVFFTATPDYSEKRTLGVFAPYLIRELTLSDALELNLFAPLKVKVISVRADASRLKVVGGDFDEAELGRVMSEAGFLEATRYIRWDMDGNAKIPTLICCASADQARDMLAYLLANKPSNAPEPAIILAGTKNREEILERFEAGELDTLINVGVLIEGWDSPRCKLEIDLAPSLSEVRAKQKYFRVMTRDNDTLARIFVLVPECMPRMPIFPQSLFGLSVDVEGYEEWMGKQRTRNVRTSGRAKKADPPRKGPRVEGAQATTFVIHEFDSTKVRLNPRSGYAIRSVITTKYAIRSQERLPRFWEFLNTWFETETFQGFGAHLLRYCGVPLRRRYFLRFLYRLYPDIVADRLLARHGTAETGAETDIQAFNYLCTTPVEAIGGVVGSRSECDPWSDDYDLDAHVDYICFIRFVQRELSETGRALTSREKFVVNRFFVWEEPTYEDIARDLGLSGQRTRQILGEALRKLRYAFEHPNDR